MNEAALESLPVLLHDGVMGMVSRRDVVRAIANGDLDARHADEPSRA
jgi:CBS domain-containing protein